MENVKIIEIKKSVFENNDRAADELRGELKTKGVFLDDYPHSDHQSS